MPAADMKDLTYDMILNKYASQDYEYGSYGDSDDQNDYWQFEEEEGAISTQKQKRPRRNETYEKAIFELIE